MIFPYTVFVSFFRQVQEQQIDWALLSVWAGVLTTFAGLVFSHWLQSRRFAHEKEVQHQAYELEKQKREEDARKSYADEAEKIRKAYAELFDQFEKRIAWLEEQIAWLEEQNRAKDLIINELNGRLELKEKAEATLLKKNAELQTQLGELQKRIADLEKGVSDGPSVRP